MVENPYPIPRQLRQSGILVGGGGDTYGPFDFKIFDPVDVVVCACAADEERFTEVAGITVTKVNGNTGLNPLDNFTIQFPYMVPASTRYVVLSSRIAARDAGVMSGTRIDPDALEKEFSKIATQQQELRRDLGRAVMVEFGEGALVVDAGIQDGDTIMREGDRFVAGPNLPNLASSLIAEAAAEANRARSEADRSDLQANRSRSEADRAAGYVNDIVSEKEVPIYATVAGMPFISVTPGMSVINVRGRNSPTDGDGGLYGTANNGSPDKFASLDGRTWYKIFKKPLLIVVSGQSNPANVRDYNWQPESNLYPWNATGVAIGTGFMQADNTKISVPVAFANEFSKQFPDRSVFVVTGARPGRTIANWLPGAPDEDVYALLKARVEAAMAVLGVDKIDRFLWWQGESDAAAPNTYEADFEAVIVRLRGETWFPYNTNMTIMGVVSAAINGSSIYRDMNLRLQRCAAKDAQHRMFFYTPGATIQTIDPTGAAGDWNDVLHVNGPGTFKVGTAAAKKSIAGGGGFAGNGLWRDPETGNFGLGPDSLAGQLLDIRRDANSAAMLRAANLNAGASADAGFLALCANGSLDIRAYGSTQSGRAQIAWSGATSLDIKAINAGGGLRFFIGSGAENMRLSTTGLNLLLGELFLNSQQVLKRRITGWGTPAGGMARGNFDPGSISLPDLALRVNALLADLHAGSGGHGLLGN